MMRLRRLGVLGLACLVIGSPGCLIEYTVGGAATSAGACPEGQVACGDGCAVEGACADCPVGQVLCDGACVAAGSCDEGVDCPTGQIECEDGCAPADTCPCELRCDSELETCEDGVCSCRPGLTRCGDACVDTRADPAHCDGCGKPCGGAALCQDGACTATCAAPMQGCDGACVDVSSDSLHCGDCGKLCPADELCLSGECHPFDTIDGCDSCPCSDACESVDSEGDSEGDSDGVEAKCCDSPFLGAPVCVQVDCT